MSFYIQGGNFYSDGRKVFLNSGEIHYFRIRRELWDKHLEAAAEAGLSTVSTYVPWAWHEPDEGFFDFDGASCPERDLRGWLSRCQAHGLSCIVKPGPFILAEYRGAGLPDWFMDHYHDEVKMRDRRGRVVRSDGVSLFNQKYLEKVSLWYDRIMPFIRDRESKAGGPVIMMQICNEIGVFSWLARQGDYGNGVRDRFIFYLESRFSGIEEVNALWETNYRDFSEVELPPDVMVPYASKGDRGRDREWHRFWRKYYGDYLRMLAGMARDRGITVPLYHNLPGWIFGSGYEFPVNITMYEDLFREKSELVFGVDHIPEFLSYRNMHDDRIINDITRAMQGEKPLFAAEFQCGSREYQVVTNPRELELFYKASLAHGLRGWNYYMFSQGRNPRRKGYSGDTFYWFTPLTPEGERTSAYPLVRHMSRMLNVSVDLVLNAERKAGICVLFYPPYYSTELERPAGEDCGLVFNPSAIRRRAWFDGLLKVLQVLNVDYDMADLKSTTSGELSAYSQVWAFCTDEMDARDQKTLIAYAESGGNLVVFPYLPDREMSQKPCTLLREALRTAASGTETIDSPLIDILGFQDIKCANPLVIYDKDLPGGAEVIARTLSGKACGFIKKTGKGSVLHLGTWTGFDTEGQKPVYEAILERSGATLRQAFTDNFRISARERFTEEGSGILFIGNYYNEAQTAKVTYTHPATGEKVTIPLTGDSLSWPPLYGVLTPLNMKVCHGISVLHCTSDILEVVCDKDCLELVLSGDRDLPGEIVLEGLGLDSIISASISGSPAELIRYPKHTALHYNHIHKNEIILRFNLK